MAQLSGRDAPDESATAQRTRLPGKVSRLNFLNRVSIQSKLILMLVLCTILAAAIVGGIAYQTGRNSLRESAINRLTEILESQKRTLTEEVNDLRSALITYSYGTMAQSAIRDFTAGFDPDPTAVDDHTFSGSGQQPDSKIVTGIPATIAAAMKSLVAFWWENPGQQGTVPQHIVDAFQSQAVIDFCPTRG